MSYDLPGNDIGSVYADSPVSCREQCASRSDCKAYTHVWDDNKCYLKSGTNGNMATFKLRVTSGVKLMKDSPSPCDRKFFVTANCDYPGFDIRNFPAPNFQYCYQGVTGEGFTWSDYNGGTCWIKSFVGDCVPSGNKYSGFLAYAW